MKFFRKPKPKAVKIKQKNKLRKALSLGLLVAFALVVAGTVSTIFHPGNNTAVADPSNQNLIQEGSILYRTSCLSCHGLNLEGVKDRGPTLVGKGSAATYFQVSTGRMPAAKVESQPISKPPMFNAQQTLALSEYVQSVGGGPSIYLDKNGNMADGSTLDHGNPARGSELFRLNCSSCHNFTGQGGALSEGKFAPPLNWATGQQIYDAMQSGPQSMPAFADTQLSPRDKIDIITYIKLATQTNPQGGYGLGGFGPAPEGIAMWVIGIVAVVGLAMWIGSRS